MTEAHRWQVSGSAAEKYEKFVASFFQPWAEALVARASLRPGWQVLDVACGTGVVTREIGPVIGETGTVVGSDLNEEMLSEARRHRVDGAPVRWQQADATDLPFESGTFDAVFCQQGLQFVPDRAVAVAEMGRVLRTGGTAAVSVWCPPNQNPYIAALADGLARHVSAEAGQAMLAPCQLGDLAELVALFAESGFESVDVETIEMVGRPIDALEAIAGNLSALPMSEQIAAMEEAPRTRMLDDIVNALDEHVEDGMLRHPMAANVALAVT